MDGGPPTADPVTGRQASMILKDFLKTDAKGRDTYYQFGSECYRRKDGAFRRNWTVQAIQSWIKNVNSEVKILQNIFQREDKYRGAEWR